jgi:hypothetical protein
MIPVLLLLVVLVVQVLVLYKLLGCDASCTVVEEMTTTVTIAAKSHSTESIGKSETGKENATGTDGTSLCKNKLSNARWAILRNAIVKKLSTLTTTMSDKACAVDGSIQCFSGFNLLPWESLACDTVPYLQSVLTTVLLDPNDDLVTILETSLLALTAMWPSQWLWEFAVTFQSRADLVHYGSAGLAGAPLAKQL